jgi:GNAT superfamily N-acetyltransferase
MNQSRLELRLASEDFSLIPVAAELMREYQIGLDVDLCFQDFEAELAQLPGKYSEPEGCLLVGFVEGFPAAVGGLRPLEGAVEIKRMYIRQQFRGQGLGRELMERLLDEANARGHRRVVLDTLSRLIPAIGLYRSFGFVEIEPYNYNPEDDVRYFELDLASPEA